MTNEFTVEHWRWVKHTKKKLFHFENCGFRLIILENFLSVSEPQSTHKPQSHFQVAKYQVNIKYVADIKVFPH